MALKLNTDQPFIMTDKEEKENDMKVLFITTNIGSIFEVQESDSVSLSGHFFARIRKRNSIAFVG